jgi:hypothetical protein
MATTTKETAMTDPLNIINDILRLDLVQTVRGDEHKGRCPDSESGGTTTLYLNRAECEALSRAFARAAEVLQHIRRRRRC